MKGGKVLKNVVVILISLGVLVLLLLYMSGAFHAKIEPGRIQTARETVGEQATYTVQKIVDVERVEVVGTLRAVRRSEVSPKIMAEIKEMNVRAGEQVKKGDVLARLDDRDAKARLEQANQAVVAAEASLENARKDYERYKDLLDQKVITKQDFDEREARFKVAQAELKRAKEAVVGAETMVSYTVIEAPLRGIVVDKLVDVGDTAAPGKPLMTIYDPTGFRLEAAVPEALVSEIAVDTSLRIRLDTLGLTLDGTVSEIVPQAETASRSMLVKVAVPEEPRMVEGMFGRLLIPSRERIRYCVAASAVREIGQLRFVDVVTKEGELERRQIVVGEHTEMGRVEVLSGLEAGERVVLYGPPPPAMPGDEATLMGGKVK